MKIKFKYRSLGWSTLVMKNIDLQSEISKCSSEEEVAAVCDKAELDREAVMRDRRQCMNTKPATSESFARKGCEPMFMEKKRKKKKY
ncbi:hypothetical protein LCGC14_0568300 [marine sediment metagenome]|uniref:Uncharacterized protein n=1 Tax=marine sediment metagenome TaxID=412755 RepID=A0A0F9UTA1_9ZZZZ